MSLSPFDLLRKTVAKWQADNIPTQAAALAYYTIFALAPLLLVVLAVAGFFAPADAARARLLTEISGLIGKDGAEWIGSLLERASASQGSGVLGVILGTGGLLLGASGAFGQLQQALNKVWKAVPPAHLGALLRARAVSFGLVLVMSFLLLVSLSVSAVLSGLGAQLGLDDGAGWLWGVFYEVVSAALVAFLFALIYRFLPDAPVRWHDALVGGALTSVLFAVGKSLIGLYLGQSAFASVFGTAGTLAVLLLWVYYAAQLVLFGAEFTQVYSQRHEVKTPDNHLDLRALPAEQAQTERIKNLESMPVVRATAGIITVLAVLVAWRSSRSLGGFLLKSWLKGAKH